MIDAMTRPMIMGMFMIPDLRADTPLIAWNQMGRKYTMTIMTDPMQKLKQIPAATLRLARILGGTVAISCRQSWMQMKAIKRTAKSTRSAMTRALLHA